MWVLLLLLLIIAAVYVIVFCSCVHDVVINVVCTGIWKHNHTWYRKAVVSTLQLRVRHHDGRFQIEGRALEISPWFLIRYMNEEKTFRSQEYAEIVVKKIFEAAENWLNSVDHQQPIKAVYKIDPTKRPDESEGEPK